MAPHAAPRSRDAAFRWPHVQSLVTSNVVPLTSAGALGGSTTTHPTRSPATKAPHLTMAAMTGLWWECHLRIAALAVSIVMGRNSITDTGRSSEGPEARGRDSGGSPPAVWLGHCAGRSGTDRRRSGCRSRGRLLGGEQERLGRLVEVGVLASAVGGQVGPDQPLRLLQSSQE